MGMARGRATLLTLGFGLLVPEHGLGAQEPSRSSVVVVGSVQDLVQDRPLPEAALRFFERPSGDTLYTQLATQTTSDAEGRFATSPLLAGTYRLEVDAPGYQVMDERILVDGASPMDLQVRMAPELVALEGITVVSRRSRLLEDTGFYERRSQGLGRTFTRDEIREQGYIRASDILRMVPGTTLRRASNQGSPYVFLRGGCRPDIIMDGLNLGPDVPVDDIMPADNLEGLEVHGAATVPIQFRGNPCGAVVMWSIDPSVLEEGEPFSWKRLLLGGFVVLGLFLAG